MLVLFAVVSTIINAYLLFFVYRLNLAKECDCAETGLRKFLVGYLAVIIVVNVLIIGFSLNNGPKTKALLNKYGKPISYVMVPLTVSYFLATLAYIYQLKQKSCNCTDTPETEVRHVLDKAMAIVASIGGVWIVVLIGAIAYFTWPKPSRS